MPEAFSTAVSFVWSGVKDFSTTVTGDSLLLAPVALSFVGAIVGIGKGLFRFGRRK